MRRWIWMIVLVIVWGTGLAQWHSLLSFNGKVFLDFGEGAGVEAPALRQATERLREAGETPPGLAAWSVEREVQVENAGLGRVCSADCMTVFGDREAAAFRELAGGSFGLSSDRDTCVISRGLAFSLFGSEDVVGRFVRCRGTAYTVRGVIRDEGNLIVIPARTEAMKASGEEAPGGKASGSAREPGRRQEPGEGTEPEQEPGAGAESGPGQEPGREAESGREPGRGQEPEPGRLRYMLLDFETPGRAGSPADGKKWENSGGEAARQFLSGHSLGTPRYLVDGTVGPAAAGLSLLLPLAAILGKGAWAARGRTPGGLPITCLGAVLVMAGAVLLLGAAGTRFPEELLPTRWSDFDFWARRGREMVPALRFAGEPGQTRWICLLRCRCAVAAASSFAAVFAVFKASVKGKPDCNGL